MSDTPDSTPHGAVDPTLKSAEDDALPTKPATSTEPTAPEELADPAEQVKVAEPTAPGATANEPATSAVRPRRSAKDLFALPSAIGWRDHVIALALGGAYVIWLLATVRSLGFARDESFYFRAGADYSRWFEMLLSHTAQAFERNTIDGIWSDNHEHPALMKTLFGISWALFHEKWHVFDDASTAFRFPAMAVTGMGVGLTYLFGARAFSRRAGAVAAVLLGAMPHVFYNAHLACFDAPIMSMWLLSVYVTWRAETEGGLAWALAAGVAFGLALETKHNAWILPAVFVPYALFVHGAAMQRSLRAGRVELPATLVSMAVVGPLVFYALWPWMWADTAERVKGYLEFHLNHEYYNIEYLGKNYFGPPSPPSYAPVLILATVPTITIVLFVIGGFDRLYAGIASLVAWARKPDANAKLAAVAGATATATATAIIPDAKVSTAATSEARNPAATDLLLALAFVAPLAVFFLPKTPIFGGTKHWLPAYPFLAIFAGRGFDLVATKASAVLTAHADRLRLAGPRLAAIPWALAAIVLVAPLAETSHSHPFGIGGYVPLVGGTAGAADLGLNRQFWGYTTENVGPWLEKNARPGSSVFIHDTTYDAWSRMQDEGRIPRGLRATGTPSEADISLVQHELHMNEVDHEIWVAYGHTAPAFVLRHDGVPFVSVYTRKMAP